MRQESCLRISAADLIKLGRLEPLGFHSNSQSNHGDGLLRSGKGKRGKAVVVDIRSPEEFRQGHVTGSLSVSQEFAADGSLSPGQVSLTRVPRGRVLVVLGAQADTGPVVSVLDCTGWLCVIPSPVCPSAGEAGPGQGVCVGGWSWCPEISGTTQQRTVALEN